MLCIEHKRSSPHLSAYFAQADSIHDTLPPNLLSFNMIHAEYPLAPLTNPMAVNAGPIVAYAANALYLIPSNYRTTGFTVPKVRIQTNHFYPSQTL
ncbi:MAG: hypothetical protein H3Z54_10065 [archaeon]|nr:hypothetical protein [archaeon]